MAAGYLLIFIAITWPVALSPQRLLASRQSDGYIDMLMFWYARRGELLAPWVTSLFYPAGVPLGPEKAQAYWLVPYLSVPLQWLMPLPLVFNGLLAAFFTASGTALHALARHLGLPVAAGFTAGALFVLSPACISELSHGIPENMAMQWVILFVLLGLRARDNPSRLNVYGCGLCFVLAWLTSWYTGAFAVAFLPLLPLRRLAPALLLAALLLAWPMRHALAPSAVDTHGHRFALQEAEEVVARGIVGAPNLNGLHLRDTPAETFDKLAILQVLRNSADVGDLLMRQRTARLRDVLPGLLLIGMALLGLLRAPRQAWPWAALTLFCVYVSLGPVVVWRGEWVGPSLLSWFYEHIPMLARMRPVRFLMPATFCLAVLAAYGFPRLRSWRVSAAVAAGLIGLAWIEVAYIQVADYHIVPSDAAIPDAYRALASEHVGEGLIDVPILPPDLETGRHLYFQTAHQHPMLNYDFVALDSMRRLGTLAHENSMIATLLGEDLAIRRSDVDRLAEQRFRFLVLHARVPPAPLDRGRPFLFDPSLYEDLTRIYGPPRETDGLLIFDMQNVRPEAWDEGGGLRRGSEEKVLMPPYQAVLGREEPRERVLASLPEHPWEELRGWIRGAGAGLRVMQGSRLLGGTGPQVGDAWTFVRVPLEAPRDGLPISVCLDVPAASAGFKGALVETVALWRRGSTSAAGEGSSGPARR